MKLIIASDIHGSAFWCRKLMDLISSEKPDRVILLGDLLYHGPRNDLPKEYNPKEVIPMLSTLSSKVLAVRGNCDAEVDQMVLPFPILSDFSQMIVDGKLLHLAHGHHQSPEQLPPLPEGSVFLSGHTHVKHDESKNGIRCLNPGSISIPKDGSHSCLIYENGMFHFHIWEDE